MTTMRSMNPDAPGFVDASAAASRYANFVNQPKYEVANKYFDDLKKEKADEEAAAENLRRYNQGFALQQAEANRQQATYDKANRSDKALLDYQSSLANASVGGAMNDAQGVELANEFDRLKQSMSEEQAAEIINNKAQAYGQADRKKASEDPYYRAELLRNVALPNVDISPEKLITLRNSQINREIDLGDRKEEARLTAEERAFNRAMENKKFSLQQKEYNEKKEERQEKKLKEEESLKALKHSLNLSFNNPVDVYSKTVEKNTGEIIVDQSKKEEFNKENDNILQDKTIAQKQNNINNFSKDILSPEEMKDENLLKKYKDYYGESLNKSNASNTIDGVGSSIKKINATNYDIARREHDNFVKTQPLSRLFTTPEEDYKYNNKLKELENKMEEAKRQDQEVEKNDKSKVPDFDTYKKDILQKSESAKSKVEQETNSLIAEYDEKVNRVLKDGGLGTYKKITEEVPMSAHEVGQKVYDDTRRTLINSGIKDEYIINSTAANAATTAMTKQETLLKNAKSAAKESAKEDKNEKKEQEKENIKALRKEIEVAEKNLNNYSTSRDKEPVYVNGKKLNPADYTIHLENKIKDLRYNFNKKYPGS